MGIANTKAGRKMCATTAETKEDKLFIKKKRKKHDKIVLPAKTILGAIKFLISKALINLYVNHDKFVSVNVLGKFNEIKEEIQNPENTV